VATISVGRAVGNLAAENGTVFCPKAATRIGGVRIGGCDAQPFDAFNRAAGIGQVAVAISGTSFQVVLIVSAAHIVVLTLVRAEIAAS